MSEEAKVPEATAPTGEAQKIEAETKEIATVTSAGAKGILLYALAHPKSVITIILSLSFLALVIGFAFSGYEKNADGTIKKSAIEVPHK